MKLQILSGVTLSANVLHPISGLLTTVTFTDVSIDKQLIGNKFSFSATCNDLCEDDENNNGDTVVSGSILLLSQAQRGRSFEIELDS